MSNTMYLVTGAAGFLGSTICRQLVERGEKVRGFVLPGDKSAKYLPKEVEICEGDVCDVASVRNFFTVPEGMETIVLHIASIVTVKDGAITATGEGEAKVFAWVAGVAYSCTVTVKDIAAFSPTPTRVIWGLFSNSTIAPSIAGNALQGSKQT